MSGGGHGSEDHSSMMGHMTEAEMMQHMMMCRDMMRRMRHGDDEDDYGEGRGYSDGRRYGDEYRRPERRRVKICIEDEDGGEYCRYR
jgi:hypothetical protein